MEVLVGPPYAMDVSSACVRDRTASSVSAAQDKLVSSSCLFLKDADAGGDPRTLDKPGAASAYGSRDESSDSSSSIGDPGDTDDDDDDNDNDNDVVSSQQQNRFSLDSLEDSLSFKRGLSNHFTGKSKSFGNLLEVESSTSRVKDVEKPENPFNKRRRLVLANKWSRKSFYSWQNPKSMPLLPALNEEEDDHHHHHLHKQQPQDDDDDDDVGDDDDDEVKTKTLSRPKFGFKSQSCFSLADLQEDEEED